jgi:periplasmic divalent cation tolerance protein
MPFSPRIVFVAVPSLEQARSLAKLILEQHLAACVNLVPGVESHYWWKDKLETAGEVLLVIKSSAEQFEQLLEMVSLHHSYECPEVVAVTPEEMAPTYRRWWMESLSPED